MPLAAINTTIDYLPPELLLEIFLIHQTIQKHSEQIFYHRYRWIRVTHVCRRWRKIALEFPALWNSIYIPTAQPDWVDELIRRSQSTSLLMLSMRLSNNMVHGKTPEFSSLTRFLGRNAPISSMKRLHICLSFHSATWKEIQISDFSPSVLNDLEELTFYNFGNTECSRPLIQFFARHLPPLRSLSLRGCAWERTIFQDSLTNFSLGLITGSAMWGEFASVLARLKNLEHLQLTYVFRHLTRSPIIDPKAYSFHYPRLRTLTLQGERPDEYADFLSQVSFPSTTHLDVEAEVYKNKDSLPALLAIFSQHLRHLPPSEPSRSQTLDLTLRLGRLGSEQYFGFNLYTAPPHSHKLLNIQCKLHCNVGAKTEEEITKMLVSTDPNSLRDVNLHIERFNIPVPLARAIATLPALCTLSIRDFGRSQALSPFQAISVLSCDCKLPSDRRGSDQAWTKKALCQACASSVDTFFPSLRILAYHGSRSRKLDEKELDLLQRILFVCDIARHKIEELKLTGWGIGADYSSASIQKLELSCEKLAWNDYF